MDYNMEAYMTDTQIMKNVQASFMMEGLEATKEDNERGMKILRGEVKINDVIDEIKNKYLHLASIGK